MKTKTILFPLNSNKAISVAITKKRMKNIRLVISKTGSVTVSIPNHTSYSYAYQFLIRKRDWINKQLTNILTNANQNCCNFIDGGNIFLLGKNYNLTVKHSTKNKLIFDENFIIYTTILDADFIQSIFIKWAKKYLLNFITTRLNYIYSQMFTNPTPPQIKIRALKSMWGNCNFVKRIITFNLYLIKAPIYCIDYVIVHELCHLVHHNHGKDFYTLLNSIMPDWKKRKSQLNSYMLKF